MLSPLTLPLHLLKWPLSQRCDVVVLAIITYTTENDCGHFDRSNLWVKYGLLPPLPYRLYRWITCIQIGVCFHVHTT